MYSLTITKLLQVGLLNVFLPEVRDVSSKLYPPSTLCVTHPLAPPVLYSRPEDCRFKETGVWTTLPPVLYKRGNLIQAKHREILQRTT